MSEYLLINLLIVIVPLIMSFEKKITFIKKIKGIGIAIIIVGALFISWDLIAARRGDWLFNPEFLYGIYFFNLPIEEILFFVTVPYSILFLYETAKFYLQDKQLPYNRTSWNLTAVLFLISSVLFSDKDYTFLVLFLCGIYFFLANLFYPEMLKSALYWKFTGFTILPFLIVNYFLTSLPIVRYNQVAIIGIKFITIPVEDFLYCFELISFYLLFYNLADKKWLKRK